jgi:hypothetical protein
MRLSCSSCGNMRIQATTALPGAGGAGRAARLKVREILAQRATENLPLIWEILADRPKDPETENAMWLNFQKALVSRLMRQSQDP